MGFGLHFGSKVTSKIAHKMVKKSYLADNVNFDTTLTRDLCFWHPGPTQNDMENYKKNIFEADPLKLVQFGVLEALPQK